MTFSFFFQLEIGDPSPWTNSRLFIYLLSGTVTTPSCGAAAGGDCFQDSLRRGIQEHSDTGTSLKSETIAFCSAADSWNYKVWTPNTAQGRL